MRFELTPRQAAFQQEIREYFARVVTPELRAEVESRDRGPLYRGFLLRLGAEGWLAAGWPAEYGGKGFAPLEQSIFFDEAMNAGVTLPLVTINTVGPTLMIHGTEEQRADFLPRIAAGEIEFAIGYTEPSAGTDLASLRTRAVAHGDGWVINGNKIFTSHAGSADYVWLAARTNPGAPKHKGITIFIVPTSAVGFSCTRMSTLAGPAVYATYFEDVFAPASSVVGEVDGGWRLITSQLNYERAALGAFRPSWRLLGEVAQWARASGASGHEWVRMNLARVEAMAEAFTLLNRRVAWADGLGGVAPADASAAKVYGTELNQEAARLLLEVLGAEGARTGPGAPLGGAVEAACRLAVVNTFGGGANEIQREIISTLGLGLPRSAR